MRPHPRPQFVVTASHWIARIWDSRTGAGVTRAGNGVVALGAGGAVSALAAQPTGTVHLVLDVAGYFR